MIGERYGATSAENDFNVYAEKIFTEAKSIAELGKKQTVVARKIALLVAAYERLDSRMGAVFDRLGIGSFRNIKSNPLDEPVEFHTSPIKVPKAEIVPLQR